ncbi:extracellular solute-binding protein [Bauldia sp.]|uniref:extracellular solute-binding protein n=1 Tax=Bauldia sp. TaxID=2575872 RepID=UPI003BA8CEFB
MRKPLLAAVLAAGVAVTHGASAAELNDMSWDDIVAQAKEEGEVTFFSWWAEEWWRTAAQQFEDETGIEVNVIIGDTGPTLNKLLAEKDRDEGTIDVIHFGGSATKTIMDASLLHPNIQDIVPGADKLDPKLSAVQEGVDVKGHVIPVYRNQTGLLYNPDRVSSPPQSWDELVAFIAENPNQFAFTDPTKGGSGQAMVQTALFNVLNDADRYEGDTELDEAKVADWDQVWAWFNDIEDEVIITASNFDSIERLNQGEVSLVVAWDDDTSIALKKGTLSPANKLYIPEMGLPGGGDTLGVVGNAPNKAAGLAFIAYLVRPEVQTQMNQMIGSYLARTDVAGQSELIPEEQRQQFGTGWVPAPYKAHFAKEFVANVLQQ